MSDNRPKIPADLQRRVMIETGYSCAVCRARLPLEIDHIVNWSKVKEHTFDNLIALCPTCHALKKDDSNPRHINRSSLKKIKSNLMLLNGRYSDIERRFIDFSREIIRKDPSVTPNIQIASVMHITVRHIIDDKIVHAQLIESGFLSTDRNGFSIDSNQILLTLTSEGKRFIEDLNVA